MFRTDVTHGLRVARGPHILPGPLPKSDIRLTGLPARAGPLPFSMLGDSCPADG